MSEPNRANMWKLTVAGVAIAATASITTGLIMAHRVAPPSQDAKTQDAKTLEARSEAPSAAPRAITASAPGPVAQAPAPAPAATGPVPVAPARQGTPPSAVVSACNRQAEAEAGSAPREGKDKVLDVGKDAGIGALGGAAVGALGGAIADGGKGAGKGAVIGGLVGAGGGTLYGIWDNKKNDERFRAAYGTCMKAKGYTT
jgi:hypothetical protein